MALVQINRNPSPRDLAWFGVLLAAFFGIVGLLARRSGVERLALALWAIGVALPIVYYAIPPLRKPLFVGWMYAAFPIGFVVSYVVLAAIYYGIFVPTSVAMRLVGYDPMRRRWEPARSTYWVEHRSSDEPSGYFNQY